MCLCSGRPHWIHGGLAKTGLVPRGPGSHSGSENRQWSLVSASWNELVRWGSTGAATGAKGQDEHQMFSLSRCKQTGSSGPTSRSRPPSLALPVVGVVLPGLSLPRITTPQVLLARLVQARLYYCVPGRLISPRPIPAARIAGQSTWPGISSRHAQRDAGPCAYASRRPDEFRVAGDGSWLGGGSLLVSCHGRGTTPREKIPSDDDDR